MATILWLLVLGLGGAMAEVPAASSTASGEAQLGKAKHLILVRDYAGAAKLLRQEAGRGNAAAQYRLAMLLSLGLGLEGDPAEVMRLLATARAGGEPRAARLLAALDEPPRPLTQLARPPWRVDLRLAQPPVDPAAIDAAGNDWIVRAAARGNLAEIARFIAPSHFKTVSPGGGPLLAASRMGQDDALRQLLLAGAPVAAADRAGTTALMAAAARPSLAQVRALIDRHAGNAPRDRRGRNALAHAARACATEVADLLLRSGVAAEADSTSSTPLHEAAANCHNETLLDLLAKSQDIDARDAFGRSPLWHAAARNKEALVDKLLADKAAANTADDLGLTPLHAAARQGAAGAVAALLRGGADASALTAAGDTPLHMATSSRCLSCLEALLAAVVPVDVANRFGDTPLIIAARAGDWGAASHLLKAGADPERRNGRRETAASLALRLYGHALLGTGVDE